MSEKMEYNGKAVYFVAVKVFLQKDDELLVIHDNWGNWEFPGGRIKPEEFQQSLSVTVARKLNEELGSSLQYSEPKPTGTFFQVARTETTADGKEYGSRVFAIGFEAGYLGGEIDLGDHHDKLKWVNVNDFEPLKLQDNDWMRGAVDYLKKVKGEKR